MAAVFAAFRDIDLGMIALYARQLGRLGRALHPRDLRHMTTFDKRKDAFEKRYAHDEEIKFRAEARRNKLLGLWAAELMGKTGEAADVYARSVIEADFAEAGDEDVFRKIRDDLAAAGVERSEHQIRRTMEEFMAKALDQVRSEQK